MPLHPWGRWPERRKAAGAGIIRGGKPAGLEGIGASHDGNELLAAFKLPGCSGRGLEMLEFTEPNRVPHAIL